MIELPLFPLNTVLFPGMPIRLHIFEERYKLMIGRCYQTTQPFGVVLIKQGEEVGEMAEPFMVGCTAVITEMEPLPGGRMNIVAVGHERFQIRGFKYDEPYLVGLVESYPLASSQQEDILHTSSLLRSWVEKYLKILAAASESQFDVQQIPTDPLRLAYLASFLVNLPPAQKQDLLMIEHAGELIANLRQIYRREVTLLDAMLTPQVADGSGPFSSN
jgi:Lon protease-like protein